MGPQSDPRQRQGAVGIISIPQEPLCYYPSDNKSVTGIITQTWNNLNDTLIENTNNSSDSNQPVNVEMSQTLPFFICSASSADCCCMLHCCTPLQFIPTWNLHISLSMRMISFFLAGEFYSLKCKHCILSSTGLKSKLESARVSRDSRQMNNNKTIPGSLGRDAWGEHSF